MAGAVNPVRRALGWFLLFLTGPVTAWFGVPRTPAPDQGAARNVPVEVVPPTEWPVPIPQELLENPHSFS